MHNNLNLSVATVLAPAIGPSPLRTPPNGRPNNAKLGSSCTTCATLHSAQQELASRRAALRAVLAGIGQVAVTAVAGPALARDARQGEVSHTEAEWQQLLSPDAYAVLRQASTERRNSSPLVQVSGANGTTVSMPAPKVLTHQPPVWGAGASRRCIFLCWLWGRPFPF